MTIRLVTTKNDFLALRSGWNDLLSRSRADTVFLTWEWLTAWWTAYAQPLDELRILVVTTADERLVALFPFYCTHVDTFPFGRLHILKLIGDGSGDSDYLDAIIESGYEEQALEEVWRCLSSRQHGSWDVVQLSRVPRGSRVVQWFTSRCREDRLLYRTEIIPGAMASLPSSWNEYLNQLRPRFRTKVRSTLRRLEGHYGVQLYSVCTEETLNDRLDTFFDLHAKRWRTRGLNGVFIDIDKRRFYRLFASEFLKQDWLAFDFLALNGRTVACQMCLRYKGTEFSLQEAFDPEFGRDSAGIGLRAMVLKNAIEKGICSYDFLVGIGRHKTQWSAKARYRDTLIFGPRTLRAVVFLRGPDLAEAIKQHLRAFVPSKVRGLARQLLRSEPTPESQ
jgi:CelD/BcsL family acetyltransferase involved in cellulose biosynthesis